MRRDGGRRAWPLLAVLLLYATPALAQSTCPGDRPARGDFGIRALRCTGPGASCTINVSDSARHELAVEPVITAVEPSLVGRDGVVVGDTLVAVDGLLITTREGGRRLADPPLDRPVAVLVRRRGEVLELSLRARAGCGVTSLRVVQ
jgi:predicted metalloprotease with PDZ domain